MHRREQYLQRSVRGDVFYLNSNKLGRVVKSKTQSEIVSLKKVKTCSKFNKEINDEKMFSHLNFKESFQMHVREGLIEASGRFKASCNSHVATNPMGRGFWKKVGSCVFL